MPSLSTLPPQASSGDTLIKLDGDHTLTAHAVYLEHASSVFTAALTDCSQPKPAAKKTSRPAKPTRTPPPPPRELPMPGVSLNQALLLLHCLYALDRRSWLASISPGDLLELAHITHRFDCTSTLDLVHAMMVQRCAAPAPRAPLLTVENAPSQLEVARELQLEGFEACIGRFLGRHAEEVDMGELDPCLASALQATITARAELLESLQVSQQELPMRPSGAGAGCG